MSYSSNPTIIHVVLITAISYSHVYRFTGVCVCESIIRQCMTPVQELNPVIVNTDPVHIGYVFVQLESLCCN